MFRFSLATLLFIVPLAAFGAASLKYAAPITREITETVLFCVLIVCTLFAVHGRGKLRWFSSGFALTGWGFLVAMFFFQFIEGEPMRRSTMVTERVAGVLYQAMHEVAPSEHYEWTRYPPPDPAVEPAIPEGVPAFEDFLRICHVLTGLALAFCGGAFVCALQTRRGRDDVG